MSNQAKLVLHGFDCLGLPIFGVVSHFNFPDGTRHVQFSLNESERETTRVALLASPSSNDEFMDIPLTVDILRSYGVRDIDLYMSYMMGSRQDRVGYKGQPLSIKVYAGIINSLNFNSVHIWDPHSSVTPALLNNCVVHLGIAESLPHEFWKGGHDDYVIVAPDLGAAKRCQALAAKHGLKLIQFSKTRDPVTGKLSAPELVSGSDLIPGAKLAIVDDCISNGGTFIAISKLLRERAPRRIDLIVTHADSLSGLITTAAFFDFIITSRSRTIDIDKSFNNILVDSLRL